MMVRTISKEPADFFQRETLDGARLSETGTVSPTARSGRGTGGCQALFTLDLDAPLEVGPVFYRYARGRQISENVAGLANLHFFQCRDVAGNLAVDNHLARVNFRLNLPAGPYGQAVLLDVNGAVKLPFDQQVFISGQLSV